MWFHTRSGVLTCKQNDDFIELDFPATPATAITIPPTLSEALGVEPVYLGKSCFDYLAAFDSEDAVRSLKPDFRKMEKIPVRGVIATAPADDPSFDFVSRFFAPALWRGRRSGLRFGTLLSDALLGRTAEQDQPDGTSSVGSWRCASTQAQWRPCDSGWSGCDRVAR